MPFEQITPRPFTQAGIAMFAPIAPGVYGISNAREWVYIGEAVDIRGALTAHLKNISSPQMKREPTGFVFELCERTRWTRQDRLVFEYEPICNRQPAQTARTGLAHRPGPE